MAVYWRLSNLLAKAFLNSLPDVTSISVGFQLFQAFVEDFTVPIRNRNRVGAGCDSIPQRLHVVDLLFDRQVVEAGRRQWDGFGHKARRAGDCPIQYNAASEVHAAPLHSCKVRRLHAFDVNLVNNQ